jgi:hypothetical protein
MMVYTVIPATLEVEVGGSYFEAGLDKSGRPNWKKKLKAKRQGAQLQVLEHLSSV